MLNEIYPPVKVLAPINKTQQINHVTAAVDHRQVEILSATRSVRIVRADEPKLHGCS